MSKRGPLIFLAVLLALLLPSLLRIAWPFLTSFILASILAIVINPVQSIFNLVNDRLLSFALVLAPGSFLAVSLIVNAWLFAAGKYLYSGAAPPAALVETTDWVVSFVVITVLFAFIFKVQPRVPLRWGDVTFGAVFTSLLFAAGKFLFGVYLGKAGFADTYGAAGSLVVILVWVYYSAQVLFLGAEFTRAYACRFGSMCAPMGGQIRSS